MSTRFFLADERYMSEIEIEEAKAFDESALLCQKSRGPDGAVFRLEIPTISFYDLPRDAKLINDNNNALTERIGDLIDATRAEKSSIITRHQVEQEAKVAFARLREQRRGEEKEWAAFLPEKLPPSCSRVVEYVKRIPYFSE